ncbi:MAG: chemotaxis protein CheY [Planctomycetes bacterium DG_23]|nr:MAG: chemotaxis protein CheY [Planctomycetes bacterium DG_23]
MTTAQSDLNILIVDDEEEHARATAEVLERVGYNCQIATSGEAALDLMQKEAVDIIITDLVMEGADGMEILEAAKEKLAEVEVIVLTGYGTVESAVQAMQKGAATYLRKPVNMEELRAVVAKAAQRLEMARGLTELRRRLNERYGFEQIIGNSPRMRAIFDILRQISPTTATVLIYGQTGTGKELVAQSIHNNSPRKNKPFVALNCSALTESILESELFGHVKGAFTGAVADRRGRFEYADGGTIFLDDVADMPISTQVKLLRVLEEQEITRVGSNEPIKVNVRLIAATNRDLEKEVDAGRFRKDLYFRLKVVTLTLPPLKERKEDIPLLIDSFLREYSRKHTKEIKGIEPEAVKIFCDYRWPGNVRELKNALETMVVLASNDMLKAEDIPANILSSVRTAPQPQPVISAGMTLEEAEKELIKNTLALVNGNRKEAAKRLGIGERTLYRKIERYELS